MKKIRLGIDASNIRAGGGVTHLGQLLSAADPKAHGFEKIFVWSGRKTLDRLPDREWLEKIHLKILDKSLPLRFFWQQYMLRRCLLRTGSSVLFSPGGTLPRHLDLPGITMSQNLLPFEPQESKRFGLLINPMRLKMLLLRQSQGRSITNADAVIFLTEYARTKIFEELCISSKRCTVIPHGIEKRFFYEPKSVLPPVDYSQLRPFKLLYVSIIDVYKHQWHVAEAVASMRSKGIPVEIEFIGPAYLPALKRFEKTLNRLDPGGNFLRYRGALSFDSLHDAYRHADAFVFASSCENLPNILLEAMAAGLPIACSSRGPMPEVLGEAGVYFDPECSDTIEDVLRALFEKQELRQQIASKAFATAHNFSWELCAKDTFSFIAETVRVWSK
ncbi:MAG: group [Desulfobulbaceae bacterium]|nr:MAG: group [Desulfobulbaceae bacterium]